MKLLLAMDKSLRSVDNFGRMRISVSNISKATVNPYRGSEIPNAEALGLDLDKVYQLLRDPDELKKAADSFNNLPLLDRHVPVTADEPSREFVVGSTGTDAVFDDPYLRNSIVIWDANSIAGVTTNVQKELSCAYSYTPDMTPGSYGGVAYDGIMRDIKGNHVALVEAGRAGSDVVIGDSKPLEKPKMKVGKLSANRKTLLAACLLASVGPLLAQDAQIKDLTAIAGSVDSLKTAKDKQAVVAMVKKHYGDKIAADADLDGVVALLDAISGEKEEPVSMDDDDGLNAALAAKGCTPEQIAQIMAIIGGAADAKEPGDEGDEPKIDKPAMDAAIAAAVAKNTADTIAKMNDIHAAVREVEPVIGKLAIAQDSAEAVYRLGLEAAGADLTGVHPSAFKAMFALSRQNKAAAPRIAQDGAGTVDISALFPNASKMKGGV